MRVSEHTAVDAIRSTAWPLATVEDNFEPLLCRIGDAKLVLLGEASHGTHQFYRTRGEITKRGREGEFNVCQLARERHKGDAVLVGFTTYAGTVTAASAWDGSAERMQVRKALPNSYEAFFHETGIPNFLLILSNSSRTFDEVPESLLERAIGVVLLPKTERTSHYFNANLTRQFDAVLHFDITRAVKPLERTPQWETGEWETFPSGV